MEDGIFPSFLTVVADDPSELEEERRLCYVGITRAMQDLTMTCARQRMIRGETQYNKMSRFIKEIPRDLIDLDREIKERKTEGMPVNQTYAKMKQAFRAKSFEPKQFTVTKADALDYGVGDKVRHMKFGVGIVENIVDGGRDYEVTVRFDQAGVRKMFASFAKLKKI
jgi:DNA helicase-2/ATP-dependent DNA helicase PcrA